MSLSWTIIQDAISAWVSSTSGLSEDYFEFDSGGEGFDEPLGFGTSPIFWAFQSGVQPKLPYAMLKLHPPQKVGGLDELNITQDLSKVGNEIIQTVRGIREITVTIEIFSNNVTSDKTAMDYLERALLSLRLPSQLFNLGQAGLSLMDWDKPVDLSELVATDYQSRAQVDVHFYFTDSVSETTGYIKQVDITPTINSIQYPVVDLVVG